MSLSPMQFDFDLATILDLLEHDEDRFAKKFLANPREFEALFKSQSEPQLERMREHALITYGFLRCDSLLGSLAYLASPTFKPKVTSSIIPFHVASLNGAFAIFDTHQGHQHFMKVGLAGQDYMEVEAIALKIIGEYATPNYHKYFLTYKASSSVLVYRDRNTKDISLDLGRYLTPDHFDNFFGQAAINMPNTVITPSVTTRVVTSGISLSQIIAAWSTAVPTSLPDKLELMKKNMRIFHGSSIFEDSLNAFVLDSGVAETVRNAILSKFNDFAVAVAKVAIPLKMTHSDLHASNVMYDSETENFVMIDYGRACFDLDYIGISRQEVLDECIKISSTDQAILRRMVKNPNDFYTIFDNYGMRQGFDDKRVNHYGILLDLAGLSLHLQTKLQGRLQFPDHPLIQYSAISESLTIASIDDIKSHVPTSMFDAMLTFVAIILRAAKNSGSLDAYTVGDANAAFISHEDDVKAARPTAIFYAHGQPHCDVYTDYKDELERVAADVGFFQFLKGYLHKKVIQGGNGKSKGTTVKRTDSFIKKMATASMKQLTVMNYVQNRVDAAKSSIINASTLQCQDPPVEPYAFELPHTDAIPVDISDKAKLKRNKST